MLGSLRVPSRLLAITRPHIVRNALYLIILILRILDQLLQVPVVLVDRCQLSLEHLAAQKLLYVLEALLDHVHGRILQGIVAHADGRERAGIGDLVGQPLDAIVLQEQRAQVFQVAKAQGWQLHQIIVTQLSNVTHIEHNINLCDRVWQKGIGPTLNAK
jgi:hypothetical protein